MYKLSTYILNSKQIYNENIETSLLVAMNDRNIPTISF